MERDISHLQTFIEKVADSWREILIILFVLLSGALFYKFDTLTARLVQEEGRGRAALSDIARLKIEVETLIAQSNEDTRAAIEERLLEESEKLALLQDALSSETKKRQELENKLTQETGLSASRFNQLQSSLKEEYNLSSIIGEWRKRTAHITCSFGFGSSRGSGTLVYLSDGNSYRYGVLTNEHVLTAGGRLATSCTAVLPDNMLTFTARRESGDIQISSKGHDFGILFIPSPSLYVTQQAAQQSRFCNASPAVGDEIVVLGYPVIGSGNDITATEGIISGFDGDFYITSAKVEQGNSGGAAILLKNNCLLGIPTYVQVGAVEALARILKTTVLFQ